VSFPGRRLRAHTAHFSPFYAICACAFECQIMLMTQHETHDLRLEEMPDKHRKIYKALNVIDYLAKNSIKVSPYDIHTAGT